MRLPLALVTLVWFTAALAAPEGPRARCRDPARLQVDWPRFLGVGCAPRASVKLGERTFFAVSCDAGGETTGLYEGFCDAPPRRIFAQDVVGPFVVAGDTLFFKRHEPQTGFELWASDGTRAGTRLVKDIHPGPESSHQNYEVAFRGRLYFQARDGVHGRELWTSDGTAAGTFMVKDLRPGADEAQPVPYAGAAHLHVAATGPDVAQFWRSDGTADGTVLELERPKRIDKATAAEELLWQPGFDFRRDEQQRLWLRWKGPPPSPMVPLLDVSPAQYGLITQTPDEQRAFVFVEKAGAWRFIVSDGSAAGTVELPSIALAALAPGEAGRPPIDAVCRCGSLLFHVRDKFQQSGGGRIYTSDGTAKGTVLRYEVPRDALASLMGCAGDTHFVHLALPAGSNGQSFKGVLYMLAPGAGAPQVVWRDDGPAATRTTP